MHLKFPNELLITTMHYGNLVSKHHPPKGTTIAFGFHFHRQHMYGLKTKYRCTVVVLQTLQQFKTLDSYLWISDLICWYMTSCRQGWRRDIFALKYVRRGWCVSKTYSKYYKQTRLDPVATRGDRKDQNYKGGCLKCYYTLSATRPTLITVYSKYTHIIHWLTLPEALCCKLQCICSAKRLMLDKSLQNSLWRLWSLQRFL